MAASFEAHVPEGTVCFDVALRVQNGSSVFQLHGRWPAAAARPHHSQQEEGGDEAESEER